jgi:hypothetical protein
MLTRDRTPRVAAHRRRRLDPVAPERLDDLVVAKLAVRRPEHVVVEAFRGHGIETATTMGRNPWFDWMGPGHDLHFRSVERDSPRPWRRGKSP